ncbi:MAG: hypothetical protein NT013_31055 [Planctomycetia bacterium]|nr:hypothetical protein [Planctomycetia bacterium]
MLRPRAVSLLMPIQMQLHRLKAKRSLREETRKLRAQNRIARRHRKSLPVVLMGDNKVPVKAKALVMGDGVEVVQRKTRQSLRRKQGSRAVPVKLLRQLRH